MSIKQIAELTGLSITTVSHALNGTRVVSKRSKELIDEAVRQVGYTPNLAAQMLKTNRSRIVALLIPATEPDNSTNCFFFDVLNGARETLMENGYDLMVATYSESESEGGIRLAGLQLLKKRLVDGILLVPFDRDPAAIEDLVALNVPTVLVDRRVDNCRLPAVYADNAAGARQAVKLLAQAGKTRIAFLCGHTRFSTSFDRYGGYREAMASLGLPVDERLVYTELDYTAEVGRQLAPRLLEAGADAVFSANNVLLMGLLQHVRQEGILVPEQLGLVGFDDYDWMSIASPPITTTYQNPYLMGQLSARMLLSEMRGEPLAERRRVLPCDLRVRASHGQRQMDRIAVDEGRTALR